MSDNYEMYAATTEQEEMKLHDCIVEIQEVNKEIARLTLRKEQLTKEIIAAFDHDHEGQKSYRYGTWKVECKTPFNYKLDTKSYVNGELFIPDEFDPITKSISYKVEKRLFDHYMQVSPGSVREALAKLITKEPGKPSVTIKDLGA